MDEKDSPYEEEKKMDATIKRPSTPAESLVQSIKEMQLMKKGKLPKKSWRDYIKEQKEKEKKE